MEPEPPILPYRSPKPRPMHSDAGIVSVAMGTLALIYGVVQFFLSRKIPRIADVLLTLQVGFVLLAVVGWVLAIVAIFDREPRKIFGYLGVIFNGLAFLGLFLHFLHL
jgi:hypothetical protein